MQFTTILAAAAMACTAFANTPAAVENQKCSATRLCRVDGVWQSPNEKGQCSNGHGGWGDANGYDCRTSFQVIAALDCLNLVSGNTIIVALSLLSNLGGGDAGNGN